MDQQYCPQCKSDSYLNPNIKIFVSPCYHRMCENCVSRIFSHGESACPECGTLLRKVNFTSQTFEDMDVERECRIRKKLIKVFNKDEADFNNSDDYEDYVEEFEDMICKLMKYKNDMEIAKKLEELKSDTRIFINEVTHKKRKISNPNGEESVRIESMKIVDPLEGIEAPSVILKKNIVLPKQYQFECTQAGYHKRITAYRAVYSLFNENI